MAQVNVDIGARLSKRDISAVTNDIHRLAQGAGTDFTKTFERNAKLDPKLPNNAKFVTDGARAGKAFSDGFNAAASRGLANSRRGLNDLTRGVGEFDTAAKTATKSLGNLTDATGGAIASAVSNVNPVGIVVIGTAATAAAGAVGMLGGAVAELSGVVGLLPGFLAAPIAAFGTLKLATQGFSDAIGDMKDPKRFAEDLKELSPNAQQAALAIQAMVPALDQLKNSAQDALFSGVGQELNQLAGTYLPAIQRMATTISSAFNSMFKSVADQLMSPETQTAIQSAMANISQGFQNLVPAVAPVTRAIADLVNVSTSFLPAFGTGIADLATKFSDFLSNAAKTGELRQWINDGVEAVKSFGPVLTAAKDLFTTFKDNGKTAMGDIVWAITKVVEATDWIADKYTMLSNGVKNMANVAVSAFNTVGMAISAGLEPLRWLINAQNKLNPFMDNIPNVPNFTPVPAPAPGFGGNILERGAVTPGHAVAPPGLHPGTNGPGLGSVAGMTPGTALPVPAYPGSGYAVPAVPETSKGSKATHGPEVAYSGDPMSLIQGYAATAGLYNAAGAVLDKQHAVAQLQADLNKMVASNTATEDELTAKRNDLAKAKREEFEAELRLNEAKTSATQKASKGMQDLHGSMEELSAGLDQDLGFSKGLPGLADNLVRFLGALATAPLKGILGQVAKQGDGSSGLLGMAFGGLAKDQQGANYPGVPGASGVNYPGVAGVSGYPGAAGQPYGLPSGTNTGGYGSSGAVFPQWVHNLEQMFGVKASTYPGHQESDRNEPGYAPNPNHQNRGIDWTGTPQAMQAFADFMSHQANAEQVIYQNPLTGQNTESIAGQPRPGYFAGDLPGHRGHVHTRQAYGIDPTGPLTSGGPAGGPLNTGMPQGLPGAPLGTVGPAGSQFAGSQSPAPYTPQGMPTPQQGWQPQGGGIGFGGGLIGAGIQAGIAGLGTMGAPFGGSAAAAGAQMLMKIADRTVKYGGQVAGSLVQGGLDTIFPSDPDTGRKGIDDSWLFRLASGLASATPALGSGGAGALDKQAEKRRQEEQGAQQNQAQPQGQQSPQQSGPLVNIETMNNGQNSGKSIGIDIASQLAQQQYTR